MQFVALVSGGKDSICAILEAQRLGHTLVACVHLGRPVANNDEESYMYQTAGSEVIETMVTQCIGVPLVLYPRRGKSVNTSLVYNTNNTLDEVEDLYQALLVVKQHFPQVNAVSSGALLSTYQRVRVEEVVCNRLGWVSLAFLWRLDTQQALLHKMVHEYKIDAVLARVAAPPGLIPRRHLGKSLLDLEGHFRTLNERYQFHVCGEGGEYESLVLDCPRLFKQKLVLDKTAIEYDDDNDECGILRIQECHAESKDGVEPPVDAQSITTTHDVLLHDDAETSAPLDKPTSKGNGTIKRLGPTPRVRQVSGGLWHVSGLHSAYIYSSEDALAVAVHQLRDILSTLQLLMDMYDSTPLDVCYVHLYLHDITHFATLNKYYKHFFGVSLPPSRSCVQVSDMGDNTYVLLDCLVLPTSGAYLRGDTDKAAIALADTTVALRKVLHVQSRSFWAPVCVGPYSQANTLYSCVHYIAGQIGLVPETMQLATSWQLELEQAWRNLSRVLDALPNGGGTIQDDMLSCVVYVDSGIYSRKETLDTIKQICHHQRSCNAGVRLGAIDSSVDDGKSDPYEGYEDEGTMLEMMGHQADAVGDNICNLCPILVLAISAMPVGAKVEIEAVTAARHATRCMKMQNYCSRISSTSNMLYTKVQHKNCTWDSGCIDVPCSVSDDSDTSSAKVYTMLNMLGNGCYTIATTSLCINHQIHSGLVSVNTWIECMVQQLQHSLRDSCCEVAVSDVLNVRLYYQFQYSSSAQIHRVHSSNVLEHYVSEAFLLVSQSARPAITVIPVDGITLLSPSTETGATQESVLYAMHVTLTNPVQMKSEYWVYNNR